ncbi:MAG: chromate transporter [Gemmatimonadales bacterium]|nr:chromate transporter [Gemmatimonadales bacterium]
MNATTARREPDAPGPNPAPDARPRYTLWQLARYFLKLGAFGFGGPVALVEYMRRDLVERRGWITEADYMDGLALSQLAPGPLAAQLAIYLGFVHYRVLGATLVGIAFVLPSFLMVVGLGWAYVRYGGLSWVQAVFYAVGAAVIGIIAHSAYKLTRKSIGRSRLLWAIYVVAAAATAITESEEVLLFLGAGVLVWLVRAPPSFGRLRGRFPAVLLAPLGISVPGVPGMDLDLLGRILAFFTYAGAFVFGSGLAIVPFLYGGVVKEHRWLTDQQFLDAVAVALITPGPVVITTGFIGFLVAGLPGATVAAAATFLPAYFFTIIPAPYFKRYGKRPHVAAFVDGVTAAAIGAISGAVIVLGRRSVVDLPTALIAAGTAVLLWKAKVPEPAIIVAAAILGLLIYPA